MRISDLLEQEGREVAKKKPFVPPPRFMNVDEARYYLFYPFLSQNNYTQMHL